MCIPIALVLLAFVSILGIAALAWRMREEGRAPADAVRFLDGVWSSTPSSTLEHPSPSTTQEVSVFARLVIEFDSHGQVFCTQPPTSSPTSGRGKDKRARLNWCDDSMMEARFRAFGSMEELTRDALTKNQGCIDSKGFISLLDVPSGSPGILKTPASERLPHYSGDPTVHYACNALQAFLPTMLTESSDGAIKEISSEASRDCHADASVDSFVDRVAARTNTSSRRVRVFVENWLAHSATGSGALVAIRTAADLVGVLWTKREFDLVNEAPRWKARLPSIPYTQALGDVNAHDLHLPSPTVGVAYARDAYVGRSGRVAVVTPPDDPYNAVHEVYYPYRGPYSDIELVEKYTGPVGRNMTFFPDVASRCRFVQSTSNQTWIRQCVSASQRLSERGVPNRVVPCGGVERKSNASVAFAVAKIFVVSQRYSDQMFHFMCESLPRIGPHLEWLTRDETVYLYASCRKAPGYCQSVFEALGISSKRVLGYPDTQTVFAHHVVIPDGGQRHWPFANLAGLAALRRKVLSRLPSSPSSDATEKDCLHLRRDGDPVRVLLVQRSHTRLNPFHASWYGNLAEAFSRDPAFAVGLASSLNVRVYSDTDRETMRNFTKQVEHFRWADVVVAAHGAALSLMTYGRSCTRYVAMRGRYNSDIYEQIAQGFGFGFHHASFRYSYTRNYDEFQTGLGDAIAVSRAKRAANHFRVVCLILIHGSELEVTESVGFRKTLVQRLESCAAAFGESLILMRSPKGGDDVSEKAMRLRDGLIHLLNEQPHVSTPMFTLLQVPAGEDDELLWSCPYLAPNLLRSRPEAEAHVRTHGYSHVGWLHPEALGSASSRKFWEFDLYGRSSLSYVSLPGPKFAGEGSTQRLIAHVAEIDAPETAVDSCPSSPLRLPRRERGTRTVSFLASPVGMRTLVDVEASNELYVSSRAAMESLTETSIDTLRRPHRTVRVEPGLVAGVERAAWDVRVGRVAPAKSLSEHKQVEASWMEGGSQVTASFSSAPTETLTLIAHVFHLDARGTWWRRPHPAWRDAAKRVAPSAASLGTMGDVKLVGVPFGWRRDACKIGTAEIDSLLGRHGNANEETVRAVLGACLT